MKLKRIFAALLAGAALLALVGCGTSGSTGPLPPLQVPPKTTPRSSTMPAAPRTTSII